MTTNPDLDQAREWAEWIIQADSQAEVDPDLRGAADVILTLLPAPQPRTLADLLAAGNAPEEYQWMQARLGDEVVVITKVDADQVAFLHRSGTPGVRTSGWFDQIVPLPDSRRMGWPDGQTADQIEYWVEVNGIGGWGPVTIDPWGLWFTEDESKAMGAAHDYERQYRKEYRVMARRVSTPWEVTE